MSLAGGCLCGAVRYEIAGEPQFAGKCYCTDCQKETGTGHMTAIAVADSAITIAGEVRRFVKQGDSGHAVTRSFCPDCGTTLRGQPDVMPGMSMVRAGTLDDSSGLEMRSAIFCASARAWDRPPADLPGFDRMPPQD